MLDARTAAGVRAVVLVHGGFVDGSGWHGVYRSLVKKGYTVDVVQNPTGSLADDVAVTRRILARQNALPRIASPIFFPRVNASVEKRRWISLI